VASQLILSRRAINWSTKSGTGTSAPVHLNRSITSKSAISIHQLDDSECTCSAHLSTTGKNAVAVHQVCEVQAWVHSLLLTRSITGRRPHASPEVKALEITCGSRSNRLARDAKQPQGSASIQMALLSYFTAVHSLQWCAEQPFLGSAKSLCLLGQHRARWAALSSLQHLDELSLPWFWGPLQRKPGLNTMRWKNDVGSQQCWSSFTYAACSYVIHWLSGPQAFCTMAALNPEPCTCTPGPAPPYSTR